VSESGSVPGAALSPGSSLPQGANFLKNGDFTRIFQRNVHLWETMKHGQSNPINWITVSCQGRENTVTKLLLAVQSFSSQKHSTRILSNNTAAPSLGGDKRAQPRPVWSWWEKGIQRLCYTARS